ncbi:MAG TPA: hypothetical protein VJN96_23060 [Vicinamibacterales bacterium]|nr:hypothetical protein [Vicinamibacterales bacterium]
MTRRILLSLLWLVMLALPRHAAAQVTAAAGSTPPNDTQSISVGAVIYYDYTVQTTPKVKDGNGNDVTFSAFQVQRSYINVTGNISHLVSFRITPDIVRDANTADAALNGNLVFRVKYAYAQFNLDQYTGNWKANWVKLGIQQTPYLDYTEGIYRYRFQGTTFVERVGAFASADAGVSYHSNLPNNYGDFHVGFFNGENYNRVEVNDQKAFMVRGTVRPFGRGSVNARGLRVTGFWDNDAPNKGGRRDRGIFQATYEHKYFNAGYEYLDQNDQTLAASADVNARGWSIWATPFFKEKGNGPEVLFRYDDYKVNKNIDAIQKRTIVGFAWWFPHPGGNATAALMLDYDGLTGSGAQNTLVNNKKWALHGLINF